MKQIRKTIGLLAIALALTSCAKDNKQNPKGTSECWYSITLDGETTDPNRFGQDNIIFASSSYPAEGDAGLSLFIQQTKANGRMDPVFDFMSDGAQFNRETPVGTTYTADFFHALQLSTPEFDGFEYDKGRHGNDGEITLSVEENSDQRVRFSISGTVMKWEGGVENPQKVALVSVDAEFTFGRANYIETSSGGVFVTTVNCECQEHSSR